MSTPELQLQPVEMGDVIALEWDDEKGYGFMPLGDDGEKYGRAYWEKYQGYRDTPTERGLNDSRVGMVEAFHPEGARLVDVGIGNGSFLLRCREAGVNLAFGHDVNPSALYWLGEHGLAFDPYTEPSTSMAFWDVLEHIENPAHLLAHVDRFAFISTPIYRDVEHALTSKHFRPGEHCWYWSEVGLRGFMADYGFRQRYVSYHETFAGRQDIGSFVFERTRPLVDEHTT